MPVPGEHGRVLPEFAIGPGRRDAAALLVIWYVRKSFYSWAALGCIGLALQAWVSDRTVGDIGSDWRSPGRLASELWSPMAGAVIALVVRLVSSAVAFGLAIPRVFDYETDLSPRTNLGHTIGVFFDRLNLARAYRSLRWTHHVRQEALVRLGERGRRLGRLDPLMDICNIGLWVVAILLVITAALATG